ncbi:Tautomerase/MIF superfamily [Plectosphaerella cucumerina]|uniref:L-dopachrome isomerase n=1 Tax=Plectosphaerella cucumerina TaxID=40658 RepID=A0A8K0T7L4_9PEZI|nr:Tautomerase/MIF superfamily [Plectosphaerella cucumerina]
MLQRTATPTPEAKDKRSARAKTFPTLYSNGVKQPRKTPSTPAMAKSRSTYFEDVFQAGREVSPAKDRVRSEAIVMAEVRTNVIVRALLLPLPPSLAHTLQIRDEFSFITDLSYQLSIRYQRPVSSVIVTLQHGACMLYGGTFDPAYVMSVFALPSEIAPTRNRRNAALMQKHMEESLGVAPARGFLRFVAIPEDNAARNGKTVAGEIAERSGKDGPDGITPKEKTRHRLSVKASRLFPSPQGQI